MGDRFRRREATGLKEMSFKLVDGHPEEISGDDAGLGTLEAHLAACAPCATERRLADAFGAVRARVDREGDDEVAARRVAAAAAAALALPAPRQLSRRPASRFAVRTAVLLAAVLLASAAAAAILASSSAPAVSPIGAATPGIGAAVTRMAAPAPAEQPAAQDPAAETLSLPDAPASPSGPSAGGAPTAESLFSRANQARRRGDDAGAIRLYRELRERFPESRESAVAGPILGQLLLDKGSAEGALSEFDRYLDRDKGGTVTEEALVGRANALMRLGKRAEERAAWQTLLDKYPGTVHAGRARQRLAELR
jgi:hypothetical protein